MLDGSVHKIPAINPDLVLEMYLGTDPGDKPPAKHDSLLGNICTYILRLVWYNLAINCLCSSAHVSALAQQSRLFLYPVEEIFRALGPRPVPKTWHGDGKAKI